MFSVLKRLIGAFLATLWWPAIKRRWCGAAQLDASRAQLRSSEARYRALVAALDEGVVLQDDTGTIVACNRSATRILGLSEEQLMGRSSVDPRWQTIREDGTPFTGHEHPAMVALHTGQPCSNVIMGVRQPDGQLSWISINAQPIFSDGVAAPTAVVTSFSDISERRQLEQKLHEQKRLLECLSEASSDGMLVTSTDRRWLMFNQRLLSMWGLPQELTSVEASEERVRLLLGKVADPESFIEAVQRLHAAPVEDEQQEIALNDGRIFERYSRPIFDTEGTYTGRTWYFRDVTARKQTEAEHYKLLALIENSTNFIGLLSLEGEILYLNRAGQALIGLPNVDALRATTISDYLLPEDHAEFAQHILPSALDYVRWQGEFRFRHTQTGAALPIDFTFFAVPDPDHGQPIALATVSRDLSDYQRVERALRESLDEKTVLLQEIHHRVKNNLQIILSLLRTQAAGIADPVLCDVLRQSQHRIHSMAIIHEKLYQSGNLAAIDVSAYVRDLVRVLLQAYQVPTRAIALQIAVEPIQLDLPRAVPCALIINELISNALKYAFPDTGEGTVSLSFRAEGDLLVLVVADNGVGIVAKPAPDAAASFGLKLLQTLARQLRGTLEWKIANGTTATLTFPRKEAAACQLTS